MKWRPSIRLVMPLCMVGVALMVMVIVNVIYSTTATTMFSQLGMSNTLQAMDQVSERLSDSIGQVEDVLREVADGMEDRGGADSRQFDSSLRLSAGAMENLRRCCCSMNMAIPCSVCPAQRARRPAA